jgi:hypothetical protein
MRLISLILKDDDGYLGENNCYRGRNLDLFAGDINFAYENLQSCIFNIVNIR